MQFLQGIHFTISNFFLFCFILIFIMDSVVFSSGFYYLELSFKRITTVVAYDKVDTLSDYVFWPEINLLIKFPQQEIL